MLGNNEQIQGVNLSDVFAQMVSELPWAGLQTYIQANSQLLKLCTLGGVRLKPDKRKRFEQIILREAEKQNFSDAAANGVFAAWYPVHKELHQQLEDYYHSDEYKAYREANGLSEEEYVLSDEKLDAFFKVDDVKLWKVLLCFSPLKFTAEQASRLMNDTTGSEELVERLKKAETEQQELTRKNEQLSAEAVRLRTKQNEDAAEIQELKKQLRQARQDLDTTVKRLEGTQAEARRASQQAAQAGDQLKGAEEALKAEMTRAMTRLQSELERQTREMQSWKSRYEEQRAAGRAVEESLAALTKTRGDLERQAQQATEDLANMKQFADLVLRNIDWPRVGTAMKLSPTMRRNFNSLVKKLDYNDDEHRPTVETALPEFWGRLSDGELQLIKAMASSSSAEIASGNITAYWEGLRERFTEVQTSLEARIVLLNLLQDIFYQALEMDDLEKEFPEKAKK